MREEFEKKYAEVEVLINSINARMSDRWMDFQLHLSKDPITDLKWNGYAKKRVIIGYRMKVWHGNSVNLSARVMDMGYPQWYDYSTLMHFLKWYESCLINLDSYTEGND